MLIIGTGHQRQNLGIFLIFSLKSDLLINTSSISSKFLGYVVDSFSEGRVSQKFYLGLSYFVMLCRNLEKIFFHYYLHFIP